MRTNVVIPDDLLTRAQSQDRQAIADLWELCRPLVEASLHGSVRLSKPDVDDLAQDAALHFLAHLQSHAGNGTTFAESLASRLRWRVHNFLRRERRRYAREKAGDLEKLENSLAKQAAGAASAGPPGVAVRRALARLSPRQRVVIAGLYFREQSVVELAEELDVTPQAITAVRRRALEVLRTLLGDDDRP